MWKYCSVAYDVFIDFHSVISVRGEDEFEILDISDANKNWLQKTFKDISKQSVAKQIAIGGAGGW